MAVKQTKVEKHLNKDPISGELGAHPVGTGVGAAMAGAAAGALASGSATSSQLSADNGHPWIKITGRPRPHFFTSSCTPSRIVV